ncbi:allograft inflammatory factor 1-like isoform X2 [Acipenser ruthenus]|uniref:allograft inflammatory factor 1-like isoform X2 n=1 Tax=Acipenser ruthenus TaxID=7906 RepID=UPI0027412BE1|nr:allograft inflammatory factor 1-like isoform X2 [Acipenser ruthenus]XP_058891218.1 allograft inflammatory factor 1-like isoform X2 [Acipenser ruthenus]
MTSAEDLEMRQKQEAELSAFNKFLADLPFLNIPDLRGKLERLKWKFIEHDPQHSGEIDLLVLGCVVQELGSPRTQAELTALVQDLTGNHGNNIPYRDFVMVMLGRRSSMCARIMRCSGVGCVEGKKPCLISAAHPPGSPVGALPSPLSLLPPPPPPSPADGAVPVFPPA